MISGWILLELLFGPEPQRGADSVNSRLGFLRGYEHEILVGTIAVLMIADLIFGIQTNTSNILIKGVLEELGLPHSDSCRLPPTPFFEGGETIEIVSYPSDVWTEEGLPTAEGKVSAQFEVAYPVYLKIYRLNLEDCICHLFGSYKRHIPTDLSFEYAGVNFVQKKRDDSVKQLLSERKTRETILSLFATKCDRILIKDRKCQVEWMIEEEAAKRDARIEDVIRGIALLKELQPALTCRSKYEIQPRDNF